MLQYKHYLEELSSSGLQTTHPGWSVKIPNLPVPVNLIGQQSRSNGIQNVDRALNCTHEERERNLSRTHWPSQMDIGLRDSRQTLSSVRWLAHLTQTSLSFIESVCFTRAGNIQVPLLSLTQASSSSFWFYFNKENQEDTNEGKQGSKIYYVESYLTHLLSLFSEY